jgi:hypothetical protein
MAGCAELMFYYSVDIGNALQPLEYTDKKTAGKQVTIQIDCRCTMEKR